MNSAVLLIAVVLVCVILIVLNNQDSQIEKYTFASENAGPRIGFIGGVHGNETSGAVELLHLVKSGYFNSIKHGCVKVIPVANPSGFQLNTRNNVKLQDLNRIYNTPLTKQAIEITQFFSDCDCIVDFHEGWGWNRINPKSIGSTITPSILKAAPLAQKIVQALNQSEIMQPVIKQDPRKRFDLGQDSVVCEIASTLECYMKKINQPHLLVEIPGQNSGNSIKIRRNNVHIVVDCVLRYYNML